MNNIPPRYILGTVYFRLPASEVLEPEDYLGCLRDLTPLFDEPDFRSSTPGFYINYIKDTDVPGGSLRVTLFSTSVQKTRQSIESFADANSSILHLFRFEGLDGAMPDVDHPSEDLMFWNCLNATTQIVLDLLKSTTIQWHGFQALTFGYRTTLLPEKVPPRMVFEPIFRYSQFYRQLEADRLDDQYWQALFRIFPDQSPPLHFLINMVLTQDDPRYDPRWFSNPVPVDDQ